MPQTVERERVHAAPRPASLPNDVLLDARPLHDPCERLRERRRLTPCQRRKKKFVIVFCRWQRQKEIFKDGMNGNHYLAPCLAYGKTDRLDRADKVDVAPPEIRAITETLAAVKTDQNRSSPIGIGGRD